MDTEKLSLEQKIRAWANRNYLEAYDINIESETRATFKVVEMGKAGGWCANMKLDNNTLTNTLTGRTYQFN